MSNVNKKKFEKRELKNLYRGLSFLIISFIFFCWAFIISINTENNNLTLHDIIKNRNEKENQVISLKVTELPYVFAEYDTKKESNKYYFLQDENYLYVGYLDYKTYNKLNKMDTNINRITIKGVTKKNT